MVVATAQKIKLATANQNQNPNRKRNQRMVRAAAPAVAVAVVAVVVVAAALPNPNQRATLNRSRVIRRNRRNRPLLLVHRVVIRRNPNPLPNPINQNPQTLLIPINPKNRKNPLTHRLLLVAAVVVIRLNPVPPAHHYPLHPNTSTDADACGSSGG